MQCLGDVAPQSEENRLVLVSITTSVLSIFTIGAASVCFYASWISTVLAPWLAVGV